MKLPRRNLLLGGLLTATMAGLERFAAEAGQLGGIGDNGWPLAPSDSFAVDTTPALISTRMQAIFSSFPATLQFIRTQGYQAVRDGGGALYRRMKAEPAHAGKFRTIDGAWWELSEFQTSPEMFGAIGDGVTDDTAAWQGVLEVAKHVEARQGATYHTSASLGAPLSGALVDLNGAKIVADWEQASNIEQPSAEYEAVFALDGCHGVTFRGGEIEYVGTFDFGGTSPSYKGLISGIHANGSNWLLVEHMDIHGFNRAGVFVGARAGGGVTPYCEGPRVLNCHMHHNRVGGVLFGATANGLVQGCDLHWTGHVDDIGTGYGFSGWSAYVPLNTTIIGNRCNNNYRKGIDFHAGHHGTIASNTCARNRNDGIYVMGVTGSWELTGNLVDDMLWDNTFAFSAMYGIRVGELTNGQGLAAAPTSFNIVGNTVSNFRLTAGTAYAILVGGTGLSYGEINISNNILKLGKVTKILAGVPSTAAPGNYFDLIFDNNRVFCSEVISNPIEVRGTNNRKKSLSGNQIEIVAASAVDGLFLYDATSVAGRSLTANDNDITAPPSLWSSVYDPLNIRRTSAERMKGNIVNGAPWRDWDGARFRGGPASAILPTDRKF